MGTVVGDCAGNILVEAQDAGGNPLARTRVSAGAWSLPPITQAIVTLRYGCDAQGDGLVAATDAVEIKAPRSPDKNLILILTSPPIGPLAP